jgi:TIR domain/Pentapeptide repeats (8 copies)
MERDEALSLLKEGRIEDWNRRRRSGEEIPSLSGVVLSGADLTGADLSKAKLSQAKLLRAKLTGANLSEADLSGADLSKADLSKADLSQANLFRAKLAGANLSEANLSGADLTEADLSKADLSGVDFSNAVFEAEPDPEAPPCADSFPPMGPTSEVGEEGEIGLNREHERALKSWVARLPLNNRPTHRLKALARRVALRLRCLIQRSSRAMDPVDCTVFAPPSVDRIDLFTVSVFAHRPDQTDEARGLAEEFDEDARRRGFKSLEMEIEQGTRLTVHLHLPGGELDTPVKEIVWQGRPTYVAFRCLLLSDNLVGNAIGSVTISRDGVPVGSIIFKIKIRGEDTPPLPGIALLPASERVRRFRKAFISYAVPDRPEVLKRVQMLRLARIRYFQDVLKLEPGDRWEQKIYFHIDECDLFLLFWSTSAKESKWVLEEVRYALKRKGGDEFAPPEILPVVIEGPPVPEPPEDLAHLHFNDYLIYFMKH